MLRKTKSNRRHSKLCQRIHQYFSIQQWQAYVPHPLIYLMICLEDTSDLYGIYNEGVQLFEPESFCTIPLLCFGHKYTNHSPHNWGDISMVLWLSHLYKMFPQFCCIGLHLKDIL